MQQDEKRAIRQTIIYKTLQRKLSTNSTYNQVRGRRVTQVLQKLACSCSTSVTMNVSFIRLASIFGTRSM